MEGGRRALGGSDEGGGGRAGWGGGDGEMDGLFFLAGLGLRGTRGEGEGGMSGVDGYG